MKVEASVDLVSFSLIGTVVANGSGQFTFLDHPATGTLQKRFYRAFRP